ncbi:Ulp1 protease family protein [Blumeria hordei DH14]|uniref:Ulp1 protease family protein n=1 Tax=Blumeria graminis f. sp. hordei (strain DH14) TaxID=546991 RepID=N1JR86_BLUG1|nr:Ulp1 protease family protein [Blumeria hordei DH14]
MSGRKRKAEEQLERTTIPDGPCSDANPSKNMLSQLTSFLWNWIRSFSELNSTSVSAASDLAISKASQNLLLNKNEITEIPPKSQAADPTNSNINNTAISNKTFKNRTVDTDGFDKNKARRIVDQYWEPKPLPWEKSTLPIKSLYSTSAGTTDQKTNLEQRSFSRTAQDPTRLSNGHHLHRKMSLPESVHHADNRPLGMPHDWKSLEDSLNSLFLSDSEQLTLSNFKAEKYRVLAEERNEKKKQESIHAARQRRLRRMLPFENLVQILDPNWENRVNKAHLTRSNDPLTTSIGGTELRIKDFRTLLDLRSWLNDEIINAYIEWIVDAANKAANAEAAALGLLRSSTPRFIAHNSFFYQNLSKKGPESQDRLMKKKGAPGLSLLEVDSVFVPICNGSHWTLGVVRPIAKTIEYFDSMGGSPTKFISRMRDWLKHQLGAAYVSSEWQAPNTLCANQTNGYDCGVFVCTNAFCVAVGLDTSCYEESDMKLQRRNIAAVLLNRGFQGDFAWKVQGNGLLY